ncbi:unnamed protein product [Paramecium sonneborni]|uniref:Uncharacterized protein n=1 Tax=Paramecium sonneborni TaxID=65129 RepID=A0A8S1MFV7_9CILI|nr:unnamed protein product [Paramecium sonneborni]
MKIYSKFCTILKSTASFNERHFVDKMKIKVKAGDGGKGCVCYYRDRIVVTGAPDGGDGGKGGDIYLKASEQIYDLSILRKPHIIGNNGKQGMKLKCNGKTGSDIKVSVPMGTLVFEIKSDDTKELIGDLDENNKECLVAKGGSGGKGNARNIGIREVQLGQQGQEKDIFLEVKTLADIGLVGFPNAGKSTLLAAASRALPKIADYPFTTLNPMVGKVRFVDNMEMTIADIPGLIEDAHNDKGLGHEFLRHIERCRLLLYVLDGQAGNVEEQLQILKNEIKEYNQEILQKPYIVCINKADLIKEDYDYIMISAKHCQNVGQLLLKCKDQIEKIRNEIQIKKQNEKLNEKNYQIKRQQLEKQLFGSTEKSN